mgnify:CR=1 FL=1
MFEKEGKPFVWNVKKLDLISGQMNVQQTIQGSGVFNSMDMSNMSIKIPYANKSDNETQDEPLFRELKMSSFRKLTPDDELRELKSIFGQQTQSNYMMNLVEINSEDKSSINLYFDKLSMNVAMI